MILTHTFVRCEGSGCKERVLGCTDLHTSETNRMMNALATARMYGWKREWHGRELKDYCPSCWAGLFAVTRKEAGACVSSGRSSAA
jgi:hypothetical protein